MNIGEGPPPILGQRSPESSAAADGEARTFGLPSIVNDTMKKKTGSCRRPVLSDRSAGAAPGKENASARKPAKYG